MSFFGSAISSTGMIKNKIYIVQVCWSYLNFLRINKAPGYIFWKKKTFYAIWISYAYLNMVLFGKCSTRVDWISLPKNSTN